MSQFRFIRAEGGDWEALYRDGKKIYEGHQLTAWRLMEILKFDVLPSLEIDGDEGDFPEAIDMATGMKDSDFYYEPIDQRRRKK